MMPQLSRPYRSIGAVLLSCFIALIPLLGANTLQHETARAAGLSMGGLHVVGNQIVNDNGQAVRLLA